MRSPVSTPSFSDPDDFDRLRALLEAAGYTDKGVIEVPVGVEQLRRAVEPTGLETWAKRELARQF